MERLDSQVQMFCRKPEHSSVKSWAKGDIEAADGSQGEI